MKCWSLRTEYCDLKTEQRNLRTEQCDLRAEQCDLRAEHYNLRTEQRNLRTEHSNLRTEQCDLRAEHYDLRTEQWNLRHWTPNKPFRVDFHQATSSPPLYFSLQSHLPIASYNSQHFSQLKFRERQKNCRRCLWEDVKAKKPSEEKEQNAEKTENWLRIQ
jgi:hypothetical protein